MKVLAFGAGGLTEVTAKYLGGVGVQVIELDKLSVDVRDRFMIRQAVKQYGPDWILNCAGISDIASHNLHEIMDTCLLGAINVGDVAAGYLLPCIQIASTAGMQPGTHHWYGPAKAGVINYVRAQANRGYRTWAISPGRMDTTMRETDFPDEDRGTRLDPIEVSNVILQIIDGYFKPGANVVIRKVGLHRIDIYEDEGPQLPSMGL